MKPPINWPDTPEKVAKLEKEIDLSKVKPIDTQRLIDRIHAKNTKLQASGRKGGSKRGPTKARPLDPQRASDMAWLRWHGVKARQDAAKPTIQTTPGIP